MKSQLGFANPWLLLGLAVAMALLAWRSYDFGYDKALGDLAKQQATARKQQIRDFNDNAAIDMTAAAEVEAERWQRILKNREAQHALELDIARRRPTPQCAAQCDLDATGLERLRERARALNGSGAPAQPAGGGGDRVPAAAGSGKRGVGVPAPLPRPGDGAVR